MGSGGSTGMHSCSGKVKYSTADDNYRYYTPHGWMFTAGHDDYIENKVSYKSVPAYYGLVFSKCRLSLSNAKEDTAACDASLFTGVASYHASFGANRYSAYPYVDKTTGGSGKTLALSMTSHAPTQIHGSCSRASGPQWMMAEGYDVSDGATCERLGDVCGATAVADIKDASASGMSTNDPRFRDVRGTYHNGERTNVFRGEATCKYPYDVIKTPEHLLDLKEKIRRQKLPGNLEFKTPLLESFCSQVHANSQSHVCIVNTHTAHRPEKCSYMAAEGPVGEYCRSWLDERYRADANEYDDFLYRFCSESGGLEECLCVLRESDRIYASVKEVSNFSPACWWNPCRVDNNSVLNDSATIDKPCEVTLCASFIQVIDSAGISIEGATSNITCETGDGDADDDGVVTSAPVSQTSTGDSGGVLVGAMEGDADKVAAGTASWIEKNIYYVGAGAVALVVVVVVYFILQGGKRTKSA